MKTMLIVGVYKNPVARRLWEDGFVAELSENGTTATPSYQLFPNAVPDTAHIAEAMRARGYDGVLITRRLPTQVITNYVPGYVTTVPVTRYNWWTDAYHTYYQEVYQPGYTETERLAHHEINVWTTKNSHLIWAGTGEMLDTTSREDVIHEITQMIVPELARQGIIPAKK
ncbi:MAG: hypothetical protein EXS64_09965 [Candidatus Latescibacteria bacterium]|nr:hypothetical protein [Candidatus Latescibacterota bacterium]